MKSLKMVFSGAAVLALVSGALAFKTKAFTLGNVYCFASAPVSSQSCSTQAGGTQIKFKTAATGVANPCLSGSPYISGAATCATPQQNQLFAHTTGE